MRLDELRRTYPVEEVGHTSCFFASEGRRYVGVRLARCAHKEQPSPSYPLASRCEPEHTTNAPEGGGTTQRGDPATGTDEMRNHRIR